MQLIDGKLYPIDLQPNGGYGTIGTEGLQKHGTHDQSSHNPHKGGRGSLAGGTTRTPDEIKDVYAEAEFELSDDENEAVMAYVSSGHRINGIIRTGEGEGLYDPSGLVFEETTVNLDKAIASAPPMPDTAVWRVASAASVDGLKVGQVVRDKAYSSTTVMDLTQPENGMMLLTLSTVSSGQKSLVEINTGDGAGLFIPAVGIGNTVAMEKEFLLPRESLMEYLGVREMPLKSGTAMKIHQFKVVG